MSSDPPDLPALIAWHEQTAARFARNARRQRESLGHSDSYIEGLVEDAERFKHSAAALRQLQSQGAAIRALAEELRTASGSFYHRTSVMRGVADKLSALAGGQETT